MVFSVFFVVTLSNYLLFVLKHIGISRQMWQHSNKTEALIFRVHNNSMANRCINLPKTNWLPSKFQFSVFICTCIYVAQTQRYKKKSKLVSGESDSCKMQHATTSHWITGVFYFSWQIVGRNRPIAGTNNICPSKTCLAKPERESIFLLLCRPVLLVCVRHFLLFP